MTKILLKSIHFLLPVLFFFTGFEKKKNRALQERKSLKNRPAENDRKKAGGYTALWILGGTAFLALGAAGIYRHYFPSTHTPKKNTVYPFALVLGCGGHADGTTSRSQRGRCQLAMDAYDKGLYESLVLSGSAVRNSFVEAEVMKDWIEEQRKLTGQPPIPVLCEDKARNTWENFAYTRQITGDVPILIMTGSTHARRASAIAANFFTDYCVISYPDFTFKKFFREIVSRGQYCLLEIEKKLHLYRSPLPSASTQAAKASNTGSF